MKMMMEERGFDRVAVESLMVPHWVRGPVEKAVVLRSRARSSRSLSVCALGGSIATPPGGISGEVIEVKSFDELRSLGEQAKGKIIFFNRPMDPTKVNTFDAYGGAVEQRSRGAIEAAKVGAVAALIRSMTLALDDVPHTGAMGYEQGVPKIPAAAVSTLDANLLSDILAREKGGNVRLTLTCETLPDAPSGNVLGQITGSERPDEIILVGGHLDSWDKGTGAHDDGAGCAQAIEVLNLLKELNIRPKRTIRAVMFMNEENGSRGGKAYAEHHSRVGEKHIAAIESDRGGFTPKGFTVQSDSSLFEKLARWEPLFEDLGGCRFSRGHGGVDITPTVEKGVPGFGLLVENQRYFDYHHSDNDTIGAVNPRELELGALYEALLCYLISEEGF
jgi:Zn-dependent M28 family amino/carboxypeptidase